MDRARQRSANPWLVLVFEVVFVTAAETLLKVGASKTAIAFPLSNVVHVLIPLNCWIFLGEHISPQRWCGIAIVILGLAMVAKPVAKIEEQL
jgi:drug/metabolite transporter (DMT)-like permease